MKWVIKMGKLVKVNLMMGLLKKMLFKCCHAPVAIMYSITGQRGGNSNTMNKSDSKANGQYIKR